MKLKSQHAAPARVLGQFGTFSGKKIKQNAEKIFPETRFDFMRPTETCFEFKQRPDHAETNDQ